MASTGKVAIVIGSRSDYDIVKPALGVLDKFGVEGEIRIISAHRTPKEAHDYVASAEERGIEVIIGVAGKAAHLAGVIAGYTTLPVIALPIATSFMGGLDSLLSMVQMPKGVPVATVAVNGADNAALLAVQILAVKYPELKEKLIQYKEDMRKKVVEDDLALQAELGK
ncbi:MAG: 5-(carboxyamino)imidazole ribonucleotide mutase [Clostridia bacterium]|nr:5-(carboxyamino)imidazole ribonucleotide mutase [Clostridia bacterium]